MASKGIDAMSSPAPRGIVPPVVEVRTIAAPAERVYAAWTDAALLGRWLAAHHCVVTEAHAEARVGGPYRIVVAEPNGNLHVTTGVYRELVPHRRIVLTWRYDGPHGADDVPSVVTVSLRAVGPGVTELTLTHERARDLRSRELLAAGWPTCLDKLELLLRGE
jgi:uncharacterized protein YndB with AHSA1/START domain